MISEVVIDNDDGLDVVGLGVRRLGSDGKSEGCLMLAELELDVLRSASMLVSSQS